MRRLKPVETPIGIGKAYRTTVFLDGLEYAGGGGRLALEGTFETENFSAQTPQLPEEEPFRIEFTGVLAIKVTEIDSWNEECASAIDQVFESEWIEGLGGKTTRDTRHFVVLTYDDVVEVACSGIEIALPEKPVVGSLPEST